MRSAGYTMAGLNREMAGPPRTALVLSAGGMFGAYQAGAWSVLAPLLDPDIVVGASIGAVNGWAIAGGCTADELIAYWLDHRAVHPRRWRVPRSPLDGVIECGPLYEHLRGWHTLFRPRAEVGIVLTDLLRLRPRLFRGSDITWKHLAASCAVLGVFRQPRLDGRIYSDGGLLGALPLWAAAEMGATRVVAVHALPFGMPSRLMRFLVRGLRTAARHSPGATLPGIDVTLIAPECHLGNSREVLFASRDRIEQWVERGVRDARRVVGSGVLATR